MGPDQPRWVQWACGKLLKLHGVVWNWMVHGKKWYLLFAFIHLAERIYMAHRWGIKEAVQLLKGQKMGLWKSTLCWLVRWWQYLPHCKPLEHRAEEILVWVFGFPSTCGFLISRRTIWFWLFRFPPTFWCFPCHLSPHQQTVSNVRGGSSCLYLPNASPGPPPPD